MSEVIDANIAVHSALAEVYERDEPHFRPENKAKVSRRLADLAARFGSQSLLDLGCGTGFIIDLARDHFKSIRGVDVTPAMLERVNTQGHDIEVQLGKVESLPFEADRFDAASAYSFLDHLEDQGAMLREASRVLKPGGCLYIDLVPNHFYWKALSEEPHLERMEISAFVEREVRMVTANDKRIEEEYGIDAEVFRKAEPSKEIGGVDPFAFRDLAMGNGFAACDIHFDWFLGNAKVLHEQGVDDEAVVNRYLQECLPISKSLYKYVWFLLRKEA